MSIIDPTKEFFCPVPWNGMYHHLDNCKPCHSNGTRLNLSPAEYLKSDFLKSLKEDFVAGRVPPTCHVCKHREDLGVKSTRMSATKNKSEGPFSYKKYNSEDYTVEKETVISHLELRTSNLCNFKCRMCDPLSSSEIARERNEYPILSTFNVNEEHIRNTKESSFEELKHIALDKLETLCLTGGEPSLIKQYYDFLDLLIEKDLNKNIMVDVFTNCSVYNPLFIERLSKFYKVKFMMSIDGVGKTAEYQRKGTVWETVEKNIYTYVQMKEPFHIYFNTAISPYVLLDASSLAKFLMKLHSMNNNINTKCYATVIPEALHFRNMDLETRKRVIEQIDIAADILTVENFTVIRKEFLDIKRNLIHNEPVNPGLFANYTNILDKIRNEKFEDVFGYKLV
jgi:organic radical activating enzyme